MKNLMIYLCFIILTTSCISKKDSEDIKNCFQDYRRGIIISSGDIVVPLLDKSTKKYYEKILDHIKYSQYSVVYKLNIVDRFLVLSTRNILPKTELKDLDVNSFLKFAIENKLIIRYSYLIYLDFVKVKEIDNKKAKAIVKVNKTNKALTFSFSKEGDIWKINLNPIIKLNYYIMIEEPKKLGLSEDEYTINKVKEANNGSLAEDIWEAPFKRSYVD